MEIENLKHYVSTFYVLNSNLLNRTFDETSEQSFTPFRLIRRNEFWNKLLLEQKPESLIYRRVGVDRRIRFYGIIN